MTHTDGEDLMTQKYLIGQSGIWQQISGPVQTALTISSLTPGQWEVSISDSQPDPSQPGHILKADEYWEMGPSAGSVWVRATGAPHWLVFTLE